MEEKRDDRVEELAEELESRIVRKEETDELEEILLEDIQEEWFSEDEVSEDNPEEKSFGNEVRDNRSGKKDSGKESRGNRSEQRSPEMETRRSHRKKNIPEEEFPEDDWEDEEIAPMKPWAMAAVLIGLIVLAAIICAVLWHFTHLEKGGAGESSMPDNEVESVSTPTSETAATSEPVSPAPDQTTASVPASPSPSVVPPSVATPATPPSQTTQPGTQASAAVQEPISGTTAMDFTQDIADVTPKDVINLRSEPSTLNADNIVAQAKNGEILNRTGVNGDTGWTRIDYNGETLYAVTQYLTTDLTYKPPVQAADPNRVSTMDGRIILFTDCSDNITPKEYVNLRTEPSTSEGESTVRCQISNGEVVHRTGYSPDAGWSRVEYNGEILYVVSSYMYTVE